MSTDGNSTQKKNDLSRLAAASCDSDPVSDSLRQNIDQRVHENEEKTLIKQLQEKNKILEEQVMQLQARMKKLEDQMENLQCGNATTTSEVATASSNRIEQSTTNQLEKTNDDESKLLKIKTDVVGHATNIQREHLTSQEVASDNKSEPTTNCSIGAGNRMFNRWMNSREANKSLWSNEEFRDPLLSYIGAIYGQKRRVRHILEPLRIQHNSSDELDQLYTIIKKLEREPGALDSLETWRTNRTSHRLDELKIIFEYKTLPASILDQWRINVAHDVTKIVDISKISAYFDFICRDGEITAEVGEYLKLDKENIFGGTDYDSNNDKITLVGINLTQSTIALADNSVDLITCFVTLHHVSHLNSMLRELIRILKPNGYLILREHDCKKEYSFKMKYLNFVHAFMMIVRIGEFAHLPIHRDNQETNEGTEWQQLKANIINYTSSIQYHARNEWNTMFDNIGFRWKATLEYGSCRNPQALYYSVFQLHSK